MFTKVCFLFTSRFSLLRLYAFSFTCAFLQPTDRSSVRVGAGESTLLLCLLSLLCSSLVPCRRLWSSAFATVLTENLRKGVNYMQIKRINGIKTSKLQRYDTLFFTSIFNNSQHIAPQAPHRAENGMALPTEGHGHAVKMVCPYGFSLLRMRGEPLRKLRTDETRGGNGFMAASSLFYP